MTDKEMLDMISYYAWSIVWMGNARCVIVTKNGSTAPMENLRQAVREAKNLQLGLTIDSAACRVRFYHAL